DKGQKIMAEAGVLLIGRTLNKTAYEILNSTNKSGTPNNDTNYYKGIGLNVKSWHYITSTTAWFLIDPDLHELNWFWRVQPQFKQDNSFDTGAALYKVRERFSKGWSDWRGIWGSQGTGSGSYTD